MVGMDEGGCGWFMSSKWFDVLVNEEENFIGGERVGSRWVYILNIFLIPMSMLQIK